ncbi:hypothetical protein Pfo_028124 [Paulownia fortunei]|nr:hypothetical protein Pfo_028124 [Paulownia fortunei]
MNFIETDEEENRMDMRGDKPSLSEPIQEIPFPLLQERSSVYDFDLKKPVPVTPNPLPTTSELAASKLASEPVDLPDCEEELNVVREEEKRVMELARKTTEYYQARACEEKGFNPLQLFLLVTDFLNMVDQVCADITKKLQKKKEASAVSHLHYHQKQGLLLDFRTCSYTTRPQKPGTKFN